MSGELNANADEPGILVQDPTEHCFGMSIVAGRIARHSFGELVLDVRIELSRRTRVFRARGG